MPKMAADSHPFTPPQYRGVFVGRTQALEAVAEGLQSGRPVVISGRRGQPGVGKSALAAVICQSAGQSYGGPVLWLPGPMPHPSLLLSRISWALGEGIQRASDRRFARHISDLLQKHRALVVLDRVGLEHASYFQHGTPLLVLTRDGAGIEDFDAVSVELDCYSRQETQALLTARFPEASTQTLGELEKLAAGLEYHPQSLAMVLGIVEALSLEALGELKKQIFPRLRRLEGYPSAKRGGVAAFSTMCELLTADSRERLIALGALPTSGFDLELLSYALGLSPREAGEMVSHWLGLSLVQPLGGQRYRVRGLVGDLARGMSELHDERLRVARSFLQTLDGAQTDAPEVDTNLEAILQSIAFAMERGERRLVVDMVRHLAPRLQEMGFTFEAAQRFQWALASAQGLKDGQAEAEIRYWMGRHDFEQGGEARDSACRYLNLAKDYFAENENPRWELRALEALSEYQVQLGDRAGAIISYERICALQQMVTLDINPRRQGERLLRLGQLLAQVGRDSAAFIRLKQAEALVWRLHDVPELVEAVAEAVEAVALRLQIQQPFEIPLEQDYEAIAALEKNLESRPEIETPEDKKAPSFFTGYEPFRLSLSDGRVLDPFDQSALSEMLESHRVALAEASKMGDMHRQAAHDQAIAQIAALQGQPRRAMSHFRRAIRRQRQAGDLPAVAHTLEQMGDLALRGGDSEEAMCQFMECLQIRESMADEPGRAAVIGKLGRLYLRRGELETAREHLDYGQLLFEQLEDAHGRAATILMKSLCLIESGRIDGALELAEGALEAAVELNAPTLVAEAEQQLARIAMLQGEKEAGLNHLRRAAHLNHASANIEALSETFLLLGQLHRVAGHGAASISYHRRLCELAQALRLPDIEAMALSELAKVLSAKEDWQGALDYLQRAIDLRRSAGHDAQVGGLELERAEIHLLAGDVEGAIRAIHSATQYPPAEGMNGQPFKAQYLQGVAMALLGYSGAAQGLLSALLEGDKDHKGAIPCLYLMGQLKLCDGALEEAQALWFEAAELLTPWDQAAAQSIRSRAEALPV